KSLGPAHPNVATTLNNLAELYREQREYGRAEPLFRQALTIWEKRLGPEHPTVATALNNLATLYREQGEYGRAEPLFQRALTIWQKSLGPAHPNVATALHNLATLYREQGEYGQAEPLFQRALAIREKELGPAHPTVAATLHGLAILYAAQGAEAQAIALQTRCNDIREHYLTLLLAAGSEEEKRAYLATFTDEMHLTLSLHLRFAPHDPQAARLALTTVLRRKGRVLDALTDSLATVRRHLSAEDQAALGQLAALRAQLATWVLRGPGGLDSQQQQARIAQVEAQAQQLEAQISARSAAFHAQSRLVTIGDVQQHIPTGAALLEFVLYKPFHLEAQSPADRWGAPHYAAYVLRRDGDPVWVDLGGAASIDLAITQVRRALGDPDYQDVQTLARALDEQVMRPVRRLLGNARLVLLSPDGQLNLLPFGALVDEGHHYLIERLTFVTLTAGRDLLRLTAKNASRQEPVLVANPDFDSSGSSKGVSLARAGWEVEAHYLGNWSDPRFTPLEGTAGEATALKRLLPEATILTGPAATEAALKQLQGPRILHIATHGFFVANHKEDVLKGLGFAELHTAGSLNHPVLPSWENPLLRSGLALAGANQQGDEGEDGMLTALEAASLDLGGTKLVVLSACETGVGDIENGEGVYGLRRAIGMAGAESQVMSLWKVGDTATRSLMVAYYANLILGEGRAKGLRHVQLQMLRSTKWHHPFYWASFIQSGDWTAIEELQPDLSVQGMRRALSAQFYHHCPSLLCW
ncbi:MAG TPA: CHAT domain-containing protein, partial [Candidatus Binatia bacterium]|nr:CHAT domain-containing protein [Candidatus Binatia bacterium]